MKGLAPWHRQAAGLACALVLLAACSDVQTLHEKAPQPESFSSSLAFEYLGFAESEQEQQRWRSAEYFAHKGLMASNGTVPLLENPLHADVSQQERRMLQDAYERLRFYSAKEVTSASPQLLARAHLFYDCWLREVTFDHEEVDAAKCGGEFENTMDALEEALLEVGVYPQAAEKETSRIQLVFVSGRSGLGGAEQKKLTDFATRVKTLAHYRVRVVAYADARGSEERNLELSRKRAAWVRDALVRRGVDEKRIIARGGGVADAVEISEKPLPDRRAEVTLYDLTRGSR